MIAVADDQGLRLLEFIDRRATERVVDFAETIVHKCRAGETSASRNRPFPTQGLLRRQEAGV
jgi:hypothetical protein